jgi:hypothetical protein
MGPPKLPRTQLVGMSLRVDSDFVRVRGLPPAADELQFIDRQRITWPRSTSTWAGTR